MRQFSTEQEVLNALIAIRDKNLKQAEQKKIREEREEAEKKKAELAELFKPVAPFPEEESSPKSRQKRLERSERDYWFWNQTYFPEESYQDYAPPGEFHRWLVKLTEGHDKCAHVIHGPRDMAKTGTLKPKFIYDLLHGKRRYMQMGAETLIPAANSLIDIVTILQTNDRIKHDYDIVFFQANEDTLFLKTNVNAKGTYVSAIAIERSSKGMQRNLFLRPDYSYWTDIESKTTSFTKDANKKRIARINEARTSMSQDGILIWEGNNLDPDCAMNQLFLDEEQGILSEYFKMHRFPAWSDGAENKCTDINISGSLWPERYPAISEEEMKRHCKPMDEHDWNGNFQGKPTEESGDIFPKEFYREWATLPGKLRGVIYTDQNLSKKGKGDTTASTGLAWSPETLSYYVFSASCKSYSDSNKLLDDILAMKMKFLKIVSGMIFAFDGNVSQESTWTIHVRNYSSLKKIPMPPIKYRNYTVDLILKNVQSEYMGGNIYFPPGFGKTKQGKEYLKQLFKFAGKKAGRRDDSPDSLICAYEFLQEMYHPNPGIAMGEGIQCFSQRNNTGKL